MILHIYELAIARPKFYFFSVILDFVAKTLGYDTLNRLANETLVHFMSNAIVQLCWLNLLVLLLKLILKSWQVRSILNLNTNAVVHCIKIITNSIWVLTGRRPNDFKMSRLRNIFSHFNTFCLFCQSSL
jgi:hypothetical protein